MYASQYDWDSAKKEEAAGRIRREAEHAAEGGKRETVVAIKDETQVFNEPVVCVVDQESDFIRADRLDFEHELVDELVFDDF